MTPALLEIEYLDRRNRMTALFIAEVEERLSE